MAQEFTIRAAGADKAALRHLVARFPLAFRPAPGSEVVAQAPDLKRPRESWAMGQMEEAEARPGTRGMPGQWVLEEKSGRPRFVGQPEGGLRDTGAGYFLLMKGKGAEFIAVPVSDMFTFKPALQRKHQTLEEAEEAMRAQREQHQRANPRLARAIARDEEDPLAMLEEEDKEDGEEEDAEWKAMKERAAARTVVKAAPAQQAAERRRAAGGGDDDEPEEDHAERPEKGEDWEHEDVAADDDLDMGDNEDEEEGAGSPVRRGVASDSDEEAGAGALQPEKAKKRLKKMMRETGLEDSSDEEGEEGEGDEESESIMDEEDLDRMAGAAGGAAGAAREPTPEAPLRPAGEAAGGGKKRKSPTPSLAAGGAPPGTTGTAAAAEQGAKRLRTGAAAPAGTAAAATAGQVAAAAGAAAAPPAPMTAGAVTANELRQLLRSKGRILLADLTAMYKSRLGPDGTKQFVQLVKQVAKMEPGTKYLVLKE
ncbi:transcription initiation factor IIF subunit alpha isoform X2 isoform A [Micractinium conductrix]|uniref:Transcription initiation factor IIF subunit alpha n=1 Tax=Micractinium conductrix TaxID=554055 RepID=A0A2P6V8N2_9CHLO|nr:transcription initiation factor IIF subunit alpha isoform X2 isoform A [Micractinium conductrix]|eukprot:PSC70431.1 transcription initiation factor IIF subunit alpha isoform X2 isoform A [Micractinium conductrix]